MPRELGSLPVSYTHLAIDEAGNVGYTAKYIITIDLASLCVHIEPGPYYEELLESEYYVELMGGCGCNDCTV